MWRCVFGWLCQVNKGRSCDRDWEHPVPSRYFRSLPVIPSQRASTNYFFSWYRIGETGSVCAKFGRSVVRVVSFVRVICSWSKYYSSFVISVAFGKKGLDLTALELPVPCLQGNSAEQSSGIFSDHFSIRVSSSYSPITIIHYTGNVAPEGIMTLLRSQE